MKDDVIPPLCDFARSGEKAHGVEETKDRLRKKFADMAEPMNSVEYTQENYVKLFPDSKVSTPIGWIKLGGHQFEKLKVNERENLLGAMHQTLTDPIVIINEVEKRAFLFSKSFRNDLEKIKGVMSVVVDMNGTKVAISTHRRKPSNIINKIKKVADVAYEKPDNDRTAGNDPMNLVISDDTQSSITIPQPSPECQ